jgi:hypothetical protein
VVRSGTRRALESAGTAESFGVFSRAAVRRGGTATLRVVVTRLNVDIRLAGAAFVPVAGPAATRGGIPLDCGFAAAPEGCAFVPLPSMPASCEAVPAPPVCALAATAPNRSASATPQPIR